MSSLLPRVGLYLMFTNIPLCMAKVMGFQNLSAEACRGEGEVVLVNINVNF